MLTMPEEEYFFLDAPGGTRKTFTTNLLSAVRFQRKIALAVALSGIAATLPGGKTVHSTVKFPLDLHYNEDCLQCKMGHQCSQTSSLYGMSAQLPTK